MPYRRRSYRGKRPRLALVAGVYGWVCWIFVNRPTGVVCATRLAAIVNSEKDNFDVSVNISPNLTPTVQALQLMPEGDDISDREGRSIKLAGMDLHLRVVTNPASSFPAWVRFAVFRDNWGTGAYPVQSDIFVSTLIDTFRQINTIDAGRFTMMMDKTIGLTPFSGENSQVSIKRHFNVTHHVKYLGTGATTSALGKGQMYVVCWSDQAINNPSVIYQTRTRYYDN